MTVTITGIRTIFIAAILGFSLSACGYNTILDAPGAG